MAKNDKLLIDQITEELLQEHGGAIGEVFQNWALEQLLKDSELSAEEIADGNVDGRNDGGIDAWYTFLDDELLTEVADIPVRRGPCKIRVDIFTVKHHDTFKQEPVVALKSTLRELLDLSKSEEDFDDRYNESVLGCRSIFKEALKRTARGPATLVFSFQYVSRGDAATVDQTIRAHGEALLRSLDGFFSGCSAEFAFIGATELILASRKLRSFASILRFEEGPIARGNNYVGLVNLSDYSRFVTDDAGRLRRYLFESNVRDYIGRTPVNASINKTLARSSLNSSDDFWWLNNGVTVIAEKAQGVGKDLHLDNLQIVNGLQTTESVFQYFETTGPHADERCILVKVLVSRPENIMNNRRAVATDGHGTTEGGIGGHGRRARGTDLAHA